MKTLILKILPLILVAFTAFGAHAQPIGTTAGSVANCPGLTVVPIQVTDCNGIGAVSLVLNYNGSVLTYTGYQNLNPALAAGMLIVNGTGSQVIISWVNTVAASPGTGTLLELKFTGVTGSSPMTWDTQTQGNCEYSDVTGTILPSTFTNGTVTVQQPPAISVQPVNRSVLVGQNTNFSLNASGTGLLYQWQISTNGGGIWTDLTNNATYSNVNGNVLYLTNALITYNGYKYRCRITGTCTPVVFSDVVTLTVINPVTTTLPTASFCPGSITVPVTVTNFTGVASFSQTFSYNTACLTYTGNQNLNGALSGGTFVANASGGKVYMTWSSTTPVSFGNGTIVELLFTGVTGTSPLTWDVTNEGNCEYADLAGSLITSVWVNGTETIYGLPALTSHPVSKIVAKGQNTTFSVTTTGSGLQHQWQISTDGGSIFTNLSNGGSYSNVTTTTLGISNAQLAMSGYQYRCRVTGNCNPVAFSDPATLTVLPNIITTCGTATGCPGNLVIPVNVTDFIGVAALSVTLTYNPASLTFTSCQNVNTALAGGTLTANASGGKVYITWASTTGATIATGGLMLEVVFTGIPGTSSLTWDTQTPGNCEYSDPNGLVIFSTWNNGNATINTPPSVTGNPVNRIIYAGGSTTFSVTATGTSPTYAWQVSTNGGGSWAPLTNVSPYSNVTTATMTINPASAGLNGYQYRCIVSGACPPSATSGTALLTVTQAAVTTTPSGVTNSCTGNVSIPLNVTNCSNIGSFSLTMTYDTTKVSFEGYHSVNAALSGGMLVVNRFLNKVYISWASTGVLNIGAATLMQLRFRANPSVSTTLGWDTQTPGACEWADPNGLVVTSFYNTATVSTVANALVVDAGDDVTMQFSSVQLNGSATGGTTPYTWLWAPAGSLSNPNISNPVASPVVTTTYTLTVTATGGCQGVDVVEVIVPAVPTNLAVQDETIPDGTFNCYNATQTITVAGGGTTFTVQNGGEAIFIAGQKISFLYGTVVQPGGHLLGKITANGQYCNSLPPPMVATVTGIEAPESGAEISGSLLLFPNPATDHVVLRVKDGSIAPGAEIRVYDFQGRNVLTDRMESVAGKTLRWAGLRPGLYFVRVTGGAEALVAKLVIR